MLEYLSRPLLSILPDFTQLRSGQLDDFTFESQGQGAATPWKPTTAPRRLISYPFSLAGRAEIAEFRQFVEDRQGRQLGFWLPIYLQDYKLTANVGAGATELSIEHIGLEDAIASFSQFKHLVFFSGLSIQAAEIQSVVSYGEIETITLTAPLASAIDAQRTLCGGLIMARFADDRLSYNFEGLDFARVAPKFIELPQEYVTAHEGSAPLYLYEVTRGGFVYRLTGWGIGVDAGGESWSAADITHGEISSSIEAISEPVELQMATDDPAHPFRQYVQPYVLNLAEVKVYEVDAESLPEVLTEDYLVHRGQLGEVSINERGQIRAQLSSIFRLGEMQGPRYQFQRLANFSIYDVVNPAGFTTAGTITAISSRPAYVEAAEFGAKATAESDPNWFALGKVVCGDEIRFCVGQVGDRLYLNAPFVDAAVDDPIEALAGDDGRIVTWRDKFGAEADFPGFPYIPNTNPQYEALKAPQPKGGKK